MTQVKLIQSLNKSIVNENSGGSRTSAGEDVKRSVFSVGFDGAKSQNFGKLTKKGTINTEGRLCNQELSNVEEKIMRMSNENGYTKLEPRSWRPFFAPGGVPLVLSYVNEGNAKDVNRVVREANLTIKLVFQPPPDLKSLLTFARIYEGKCGRNNCMYCTEQKIRQLRGTVYLVTREGCGRTYVGETSPPLHKSLGEHMRALRNPTSYLNSSFLLHRTLHHTYDDPPTMKVTILHRAQEASLERKVLGVLAIKRISLEINNKDEMMDALRLIRQRWIATASHQSYQ
ncbi:hypothetical protein Y032_0034g2879 [Ancylostoma ceylanicum]|uniref:GIY-YIG domain-containing protein n=1 Tax=Ancylostoma ceylanicum TaxID=53326 RepID=A0A016UMU7_9BILA|nr:hypothetical protein Y032_0034g2879 [Ancylostoma ceylanicum]